MKAVGVGQGNFLAGTMMVQDGLLMPKTADVETDAYSQGWRSVRALDSSNLGRKLAGAGWHLFFIAGQVSAIAFGRGGEKSLRRAVERIAKQVRELDFNCLELTDLVRKHFLGVPYLLVSAHSYHIQEGWQLDGANVRGRSQSDADWARK